MFLRVPAESAPTCCDYATMSVQLEVANARMKPSILGSLWSHYYWYSWKHILFFFYRFPPLFLSPQPAATNEYDAFSSVRWKTASRPLAFLSVCRTMTYSDLPPSLPPHQTECDSSRGFNGLPRPKFTPSVDAFKGAECELHAAMHVRSPTGSTQVTRTRAENASSADLCSVGPHVKIKAGNESFWQGLVERPERLKQRPHHVKVIHDAKHSEKFSDELLSVIPRFRRRLSVSQCKADNHHKTPETQQGACLTLSPPPSTSSWRLISTPSDRQRDAAHRDPLAAMTTRRLFKNGTGSRSLSHSLRLASDTLRGRPPRRPSAGARTPAGKPGCDVESNVCHARESSKHCLDCQNKTQTPLPIMPLVETQATSGQYNSISTHIFDIL